MQGAMMQWMASHGTALKTVVLQQVRLGGGGGRSLAVLVQSRFQSSTAAGAPTAGAPLEESGFESTTISDILKSKGKSADGSWLWCTTDDSVYNAVQSVCLWLIFRLICGSNYWLIGHLWFTSLLLPFFCSFFRWLSTMWVPWLSSSQGKRSLLLGLLQREVLQFKTIFICSPTKCYKSRF